jgi:hypothetical protein
MDENKPSISPGKFRLRSASGWTSAHIDPPPAKLDELASLDSTFTDTGKVGLWTKADSGLCLTR